MSSVLPATDETAGGEEESGTVQKTAPLRPLTLRPKQEEGLSYYAEYRHGLVPWDMGTGKTLLAVEHAKQNVKGQRILIVAPVNTHAGWLKTFNRQWPDMPVTILGSPDKDTEGWLKATGRMEAPFKGTGKRNGVFIVGWEVMHGYTKTIYEVTSWSDVATRKEYNSKEAVGTEAIRPPWAATGVWDLVVADECHRMQNRKSASYEVMNTIKAERKLAMSGTWTGNKKEGAFGTLHWLWPKRYPYFWPWVDKHMETVPDPYTFKRIVGELEPGSIVKDIPCYMRVIADVSEIKVAVHDVEVDMAPKQAQTYKRFKDEAFAWLDEQPIGTPLPVVQRIRLRQVALGMPGAVVVTDDPIPYLDGSGKTRFSQEEYVEVTFRPNCTSSKIAALKEIIADLPDGEPLMVYVHSKRFVEPVVHQLGKQAVGWTGDTPLRTRMSILDKFGKPNGPRIIVAVISAIGEGTDGLQHVCANEVWLSQDDNNLLNEQCKARLLRSGQLRTVNRWNIYARDTMDRGIYRKNDLNRIEMQEFWSE